MAMQIQRAFFLTVRAMVLCAWFSLPSWAATVEDVALMKSANREKILMRVPRRKAKFRFTRD